MEHEILGILPIPVYKTERELNISESESEEIKSIIEEGVHDRLGNLRSDNSYIFVIPFCTIFIFYGYRSSCSTP